MTPDRLHEIVRWVEKEHRDGCRDPDCLNEICESQSTIRELVAPLTAVYALLDHTRKISPSDRMNIAAGDLEKALS